MNIITLIEQKRDGAALTTTQIEWLVQQITRDAIPDYQLAALLMAIYIRGMSQRETVDLTLAMAHSGETIDLHDVAQFVVDKHSSGGVGDKTTLIVQPLVAACGLPVGKMSGRGLGITGGTLDKMESISGWSSQMTIDAFKRQLADIGLVLAGQTAELAPADGRLYALRDVTGTVSSIPLIAASIMSKKLAGGADGIVLDVKVGSGAFMKTVDDARRLAELMVAIGRDANRRTVALLSNMDQPLGYAIGNALEVVEAIFTLQGDDRTPPDLWQHCEAVAAHMLHVAGVAADLDAARQQIGQAITSGAGLHKLRQMVEHQGGDPRQIDDPQLLPQAPVVTGLLAAAAGYIQAIDTEAIGRTALELGAGRKQKGQPIDDRVGMLLTAKVGDRVAAGELIGELHAAERAHAELAAAQVQAAITIGDEAVAPLPHILGVVGGAPFDRAN